MSDDGGENVSFSESESFISLSSHYMNENVNDCYLVNEMSESVNCVSLHLPCIAFLKEHICCCEKSTFTFSEKLSKL